ncbi:MAG TPA: gliding motility-associated C-terminal domain-containing protein, partial [Bacteroidales bacterium]|nr:gliding motility-associated C-terminal domain-containing protein [Bacteroidales bacterium]
IVSDSPIIDSLYQGQYQVHIVDANGCAFEAGAVILSDRNEDCLIIPNAFTPNADGINDTWIIENIGLFPGAVVQVFNRWGQLLYDSSMQDGNWDGFYEGNPVPTGTYLYIIRLYAGGAHYSGTVTVVH